MLIAALLGGVLVITSPPTGPAQTAPLPLQPVRTFNPPATSRAAMPASAAARSAVTVGVCVPSQTPAWLSRPEAHTLAKPTTPDAMWVAGHEWQVHRGAGLIVCDNGRPSIDAFVAMAAPLPLGFIDVVCWVDAVVDEPDRFGFTYGTSLS